MAKPQIIMKPMISLSDKTLTIASCVKDMTPYAPDFQINIKNIGSMFKSVRYIFVENDSSDNTREYMGHIENSVILSPPNSIYEKSTKPQKIAVCRNTYLEYFYENSTDYLLMMDSDEIGSHKITKESIESNFKFNDWDMICANQPEGYYDLYALRCKGWVDSDCWAGTYNQETLEKNVLSRFQRIHTDTAPIKVQSAFGGAAFLNINRMDKQIYHDSNTDTCEWISFCNQLENIYINPAFVNFDGLSHHITDCFNLRNYYGKATNHNETPS